MLFNSYAFILIFLPLAAALLFSAPQVFFGEMGPSFSAFRLAWFHVFLECKVRHGSAVFRSGEFRLRISSVRGGGKTGKKQKTRFHRWNYL